ncbi:MAG: aminopeptidase P family protein [Methanomicrobiaceae archaeon]|nr:aminopeptidase P family protein [Methanomicrobiaceae archaeon]
MNSLDRSIEDADAKAYVIFAPGDNPDMRYLTGFSVSDPVFFIKKLHMHGTLIVPQMEKDRAIAESKCDVLSRGDAGYFGYLETEPDPYAAQARMIADIAGGNVLVPRDFPLILARELEKFCRVKIDRGTVEKTRSVKTKAEIEIIRGCQKATDETMDFIISKIRNAESENGELRCGGLPLTSGYLRSEIECFLLKRGFSSKDTIVSCGPETAMPHCTGDGVILENEPVVIDIFPCDLKTGYYADMTRTVVRGEPSPEIEDMYSAVSAAKKLAKDMIRSKVSGKSVHNAVVNFFEESGYKSGAEGFIHSLGHGVGLAVHESPSLSPSGGELEYGNIVTVEPGLYYKKYGGVRLEDMGLVEDTRFDCFTKYEEVLRI